MDNAGCSSNNSEQRPLGSQQVPQWKEVNGSSSTSCTPPQWLGSDYQTDSIQAPIEYFRYFFDTTIMDYIVYESNLYSATINPSRPLGLSIDELEKCLAVVMFMSLIPLSNSRHFCSLGL